ncbi:hypothetical protein E2P81_ATG07558 [Venturia nashicola]|uniref:Uncharacterized protein n=1 Tax=Venturia nashicola TaxID=86259 RepID=A0A4Z1NW10_9PEZI|nr:hypothetical protein E6O75_ATG07717 [Venturia nashicola]TLD32068.1 hypothetical protein E2P81_ATG07558 [Venturia nashicola]
MTSDEKACDSDTVLSDREVVLGDRNVVLGDRNVVLSDLNVIPASSKNKYKRVPHDNFLSTKQLSGIIDIAIASKYRYTHIYNMVRDIREEIKEGLEAIDVVLFQYFYSDETVETEHLYFALLAFDRCYRERTRIRVFGSMVETLGNLERMMSAIRDILDIW